MPRLLFSRGSSGFRRKSAVRRQIRAGAIALALAAPTLAGAATLTMTQAQLLAVEDVTTLFGGNGRIVSVVADGAGVLYEIEGGTIDFGKVAARVRLFGADLTGYDRFGLLIDIVSAPNPVEINPFVFTGSSGTIFTQDVPGVKLQGDSFESYVELAGVAQLDQGYAFGFQYFTAGDVLDPLAQTVLIRVSPIPEPTTLALTSIGLLGLAVSKRRKRHRRSRRDARPPSLARGTS